MSEHRVIVFRSWHRDDGRQVYPNVVTGYAKSGTPVWHADCVSCRKALGVYGSEDAARRAVCTEPPLKRLPSTAGLPEPVATARSMWLAGYTGGEIAAEIGGSPSRARNFAAGHSPTAYRLDAEERASVSRLHAEAVRIRGREAA